MNVKEIPINSIKTVENVRVKIGNLEGLMRDIQQNGLYNPIRVIKTKSSDYVLDQGSRRLAACQKLGWKKIPANIIEDLELSQILITNMAENIHREDISPVELGRICNRLKAEFDMNNAEIAAKLSIVPSRILGAMKSYSSLPDKYRNKVVYTGKGNSKMGNISATAAVAIVNAKRMFSLSDAAVDKLLHTVKVEDYGAAELNLISMFLKEGLSVTQALDQCKKFTFLRNDIIVEDAEIERLLEKYKMDSRISLIQAIVYGELPPLKRPSFFKAKQVPVVEK